MNAVEQKRQYNGKQIIDFKRLPSPIKWGSNTLEYYAVIDDYGSKMACPIPGAIDKNDIFENLHFDDYGNLRFRDHYLDNSLISHSKFCEYLLGE